LTYLPFVSDVAAMLGLFMTGVLAGSVVPLPSETALVAMLLRSSYPVWLLLFVSTIGNVIGSVINWAIGRALEKFKHARWFPANEAQLAKAQRWYHRYGRWSLLMSWVPIVGDPLTVIAGVMREPLWFFLLLVTVAKFARYAAITAVTLHWM
jgi:membrane protein YqaA with SNARE-associated domain